MYFTCNCRHKEYDTKQMREKGKQCNTTCAIPTPTTSMKLQSVMFTTTNIQIAFIDICEKIPP